MIKLLNDIRNAENSISNNSKIINTIVVLFLGIALALIVKVVVSKNLYSCFDRLSDIVLYLT